MENDLAGFIEVEHVTGAESGRLCSELHISVTRLVLGSDVMPTQHGDEWQVHTRPAVNVYSTAITEAEDRFSPSSIGAQFVAEPRASVSEQGHVLNLFSQLPESILPYTFHALDSAVQPGPCENKGLAVANTRITAIGNGQMHELYHRLRDASMVSDLPGHIETLFSLATRLALQPESLNEEGLELALQQPSPFLEVGALRD